MKKFCNHTLTELVLKSHIWSQRCPYETEKGKEWERETAKACLRLLNFVWWVCMYVYKNYYLPTQVCKTPHSHYATISTPTDLQTWSASWLLVVVCKPTLLPHTYIELLICWTCCGVNANAKHVSWNLWLLSEAGNTIACKGIRQITHENKTETVVDVWRV